MVIPHRFDVDLCRFSQLSDGHLSHGVLDSVLRYGHRLDANSLKRKRHATSLGHRRLPARWSRCRARGIRLLRRALAPRRAGCGRFWGLESDRAAAVPAPVRRRVHRLLRGGLPQALRPVENMCGGRSLRGAFGATSSARYFLGRRARRAGADVVPSVCAALLLRTAMKKLIAAFIVTALTASTALAVGFHTVTLDVTHMDCPVCAITVRKALERVPGVTSAEVDFASKRAEVVFDPAEASVDALTKATADAGYPSHVRQVR